MIYTESDINSVRYYTADNVLSEAVYLDESAGTISPVAIPVVTNSAIDTPVVQYHDINRLVEENSIGYEDAMYAIAEANGIDSLAVAVPEWKLLETPGLASLIPNVVVTPINEENLWYQFTDMCVNSFIESGNEYFLSPFFCESAIDCALFLEEAADNQKEEAKGIIDTIKAKLIAAKDWTKEQLSKLASSLKAKYKKIADWCYEQKGDKDKPIWKRVLAYIGRAIDKVLGMLAKAGGYVKDKAVDAYHGVRDL